MNCRIAEGMVNKYINHTLPLNDLEDFLEHIENCSSCYDELATYFIVHKAMQQLDEKQEDTVLDFKELLEEDIRKSRRYIRRKKFHSKIECGMRGADGAVDHVKYEDGEWSYTTVGNKPAVGLCGSGLIDLVAGLLDAGILDENGVLRSGQEKQGVFILVPPEQSGNERGVYLTQKDIGEVQLAKAAIAAGIRMLMEKLGITEDEISSVYIAGAFGNYMDPVSAGKISLLPATLVKKVKPVGNAAGEGAKIALVNEKEMLEMDELVRKTEFIELAASADFQDYFIDELGFETDE